MVMVALVFSKAERDRQVVPAELVGYLQRLINGAVAARVNLQDNRRFGQSGFQLFGFEHVRVVASYAYRDAENA